MFGLWGLWLAGHALLVVRPSARVPWRRWIFRTWGRLSCRWMGVRVEVIGTPPREPAVVVCNHLGYLDIAVLAGCLDTVFVSKAEVASWPVLGLLTRTMDTIFVTRERKRALPEVNRQIIAALGRGDSVVVFPEGTSTSGATVAPFKASLLAPAASSGRPVHYAAIDYRVAPHDPPASESVCWWGDMTFGPHLLRLLGLARIEARVQFGPEAVVERDRKLLAEKLWRAIHEIFIPVE
jgi:1-acyl-sn-glycerol-3-phosphate acyltransferase